MKTIIFSCSENGKRHQEEIEFEDDVPENEITEEFERWVWQEVGDNYCWFNKEGEK